MKLILEIGIFFLPFVAFWLFVSGMISTCGGWKELAENHPYNGENLTGVTFRFQSAGMGFFGWYKNCLSIFVTDLGIVIRPMLLFRFMHKPIFIRWGDISDFYYTKFVFLGDICLTVGKKKLRIYGRSATYINRLLENRKTSLTKA